MNRQYQWIDDRGKKYKCTAPQYVDYVMSYSQKCISDETIFPTKYGELRVPFHLYYIFRCACLAMLAFFVPVVGILNDSLLFTDKLTYRTDRENQSWVKINYMT